MAHPDIDNRTALIVAPLVLSDQDGIPILVVVVKGTWSLSARGPLLAEQQLELSTAGEYWGDPNQSSYKYEPETAFIKPATDVVLIGSAYSTALNRKQVDVSFGVGELHKKVRVIGDRTWIKRFGIVTMSNPSEFERIPLVYERAFGGWDSPKPDPTSTRFEPRNPVGVGFKQTQFVEGLPVPNIEDPRRLLGAYGETPPPAGFGFLSPNWLPRVSFAGTYDEKWQRDRAPRLPTDFDSRFFNAASPGLVSDKHLLGNESVVGENISPLGPIQFNLPGVAPPRVRAQLRNRSDVSMQTQLDTVIVNMDEQQLILLWRTHFHLANGPHDVIALEVTADDASISVA